MWFNAIIPLGLFILGSAATGTNTNTTSEICKPKACSRNKDNEKAVCGSDGLTYPNRCLFEKARCQSKNMTLVKRGMCKKQRPCGEWESFIQDNPVYKFKPKCRNDGSYDSAQCHPDTGYCWCVTPDGTPLSYTSIKRKPDSKPRCGRKKKTHRRSPNKKHKNKICKRTEKSLLNNNLINSFNAEFSREHGQNNTDPVVIEWKFTMLDRNKDGTLDKNEYKDLKRLVRQAVKPKKCAKMFPRSCDVDDDQMITLQEWAECLTRDGMDDRDSEADRGQPNLSSDTSIDDSEDYNDSSLPIPSPPHGVLSPGHVSMPNYDEESAEIPEDDSPGCILDRRTAIAEAEHLYVPDCTPDGRYQKVQCYRSAGYCWCVNEDTGKNIPGTSVKNGIPNCDKLKTSNKSMKGCPDDKKVVFLKELLQFLHSKIAEIPNGNFNSLAWIASKEEKAATWSFVVFDKNKNKMLERNEWKAFKEMVSTIKSLRKCGKKLPRYCDSNKDKQISMTEWLDCLNVQQETTKVTPTSSRTGKKNPLSILKND